MLATAENITEAFLRDAEPNITSVASRASQACVLFVPAPEKLPSWISVRSDQSTSVSDTKSVENNLPHLNLSPSRAEGTITQLLRLEKLDADWDGSEAAKPLVHSIKEARAFVRSLSSESIIPRATLHADGHAILFVREPDLYAEIEFLGAGKIGYYARRGEEKWSDEFSFDGRSLPEGLSRIGFAL